MKFKNVKTLSGIFVFIISLTVYLLSIEPSTSFWDCSEFITCAYNLEVGHAPGAPVFMLLGRLFGLLANKPENVALMINSLSAIASALTVMILFLTIYWFAEKLYGDDIKDSTAQKQFIILASAFIGALTFAFTDSFWFSALEAEVYATSSFFTALVFWAILQYSSAVEGVRSYKWIILIFFILGLSVGIHLLNLLTLPAMALVVYFKHWKASFKGVLFTLILSGLILVLFIFGIIPGIANLAALSDRIFVNNFSLPVYSGALFFVVFLAGLLFFGFKFYSKRQKTIYKLVILSFTYWLIGYSAFTILIIRSSQNPFVDINNVENIYGLVNYLNREQYPTRPLLYGNNYNSPVLGAQKRYTYKFYNGKYIKDELNPGYVFDTNTLTFFPRMASLDGNHINAYKQWVKIKGRPVKIQNRQGEPETIYVPTFKENLVFFIKYQLAFMYGRYFMWNFVGKQNDIQGRGGILHGNWLSGIPFIDNSRLGNQEKLPDFYKNHKSRNMYYMLPMLLGIIGMLFQYNKDKYNFWVNMLLFFFTGLAIVFYLNEIPTTPRERDYVHVGSFYVFALWIGLGALGILQIVSRAIKNRFSLLIVTLLLIILVPLNMFSENWDDHNRSNRYIANACGKNMLKSCEQNAILFTTADNDTYPLWYLQEVEKYRPDVRNVLLTFLPVDWYADQLHQQFGEKGRIPISFEGKELLMRENQYFPVVNKIDSFMDIEQVIDFVKSSSEKTQVRTSENNLINFIPGTKMELKVNAANFKKSCSYLINSRIEIPESIQFTLKKGYLGRDDLLILDILAHNNWERPIYFIYPHLLEELGLGNYLHREGMLYRFMPFTHTQMAAFAKDRSAHEYSMLRNEFQWGNLNDPKVYLDHTTVQMAQSFRIRQMYIETATLLTSVGENKKAEELLDKIQQLLPPHRIPYSWFMPEMVSVYILAGCEEKAKELSEKIETEMMQRYEFSKGLEADGIQGSLTHETIYIMQQLASLKK